MGTDFLAFFALSHLLHKRAPATADSPTFFRSFLGLAPEAGRMVRSGCR
jgi:hypothetical protein